MKSTINACQASPQAKVYQLISKTYDLVVCFTREQEGIYLHDSRDPSLVGAFFTDLISYKDSGTWQPFTGSITLEINNGV